MRSEVSLASATCGMPRQTWTSPTPRLPFTSRVGRTSCTVASSSILYTSERRMRRSLVVLTGAKRERGT